MFCYDKTTYDCVVKSLYDKVSMEKFSVKRPKIELSCTASADVDDNGILSENNYAVYQ